MKRQSYISWTIMSQKDITFKNILHWVLAAAKLRPKRQSTVKHPKRSNLKKSRSYLDPNWRYQASKLRYHMPERPYIKPVFTMNFFRALTTPKNVINFTRSKEAISEEKSILYRSKVELWSAIVTLVGWLWAKKDNTFKQSLHWVVAASQLRPRQ